MKVARSRKQWWFGVKNRFRVRPLWLRAPGESHGGLQFGLLLGITFLLLQSPALGASYQKTDGSFVDPIQSIFGGALTGYTGPDLVPGVNLDSVELIYADLTDANLSGSVMQNVNLTGAIISGGDLLGADMQLVNLNAASLENSDLRGADLWSASMIGVSLESSIARQVDFSEAVLQTANLRFGDFRGSLFLGSDVSEVDFEGAQLEEADFSGAFFEYAVMLGSAEGSAKYDSETDFSLAYSDAGLTPFDPVAAGWIRVPEPSSVAMSLAVLMLLGAFRSAGFRP